MNLLHRRAWALTAACAAILPATPPGTMLQAAAAAAFGLAGCALVYLEMNE